jgi:ATP-dependent DNA ligase
MSSVTVFPTIYKKTKGNKVQEWTIEVHGNAYRTISGQTDGQKITSELTICYGKNTGKANETTDEQQAMKEAEALYKKKVEGGYHESIDSIEEKKFFEPMLAEKWEDRKDQITYPIYSQPKLDGIRCIVKADGMWSRTGKRILSAPHIFESVKAMFEVNPDLILDGELYCDKFANDFNKIVSLVKKTKPTAEDLKESEQSIRYYVYDMPSCKGNFSQRTQEVRDTFGVHPYCIALDTYQLNSEADIETYYGKYIEQGYEGQILRVNAKYENKRSKYLLKHKTFNDIEFKILDIVEGEGNRTGTAGYMVFEIDGQRFKSNVKGNFEYLQSVLNDKENLIGKSATVTYFNLTPAGLPRFPYVTKINREEYE